MREGSEGARKRGSEGERGCEGEEAEDYEERVGSLTCTKHSHASSLLKIFCAQTRSLCM